MLTHGHYNLRASAGNNATPQLGPGVSRGCATMSPYSSSGKKSRRARKRFVLRPSFEELEPRQLPSLVFQSFDGNTVPTNGDGDAYPNEYAGEGTGTVSITSANSVSGKSLKLHLASGEFYPQFNPYNYAGNP